MACFEDIADYIIQVSSNPSILHSSYNRQDNVHTFLREWLCNQGPTEKQGEYGYVWSLVYGWEMSQIGQSSMASAQIQKEQLDNRQKKSPQIVVLQPKDRDFFRYSNRNEAIINLQNNLFWINPTYQSYQRSKQAIESDDSNLIITLTTSNIKTLINFLKIKSKSSKLRLITIQQIYVKLNKLISFFLSLPDSQQFTLKNYPANFLTPEEHFQYANLVWLVRQNCWYEPNFDLVITFIHSRQSFLIEQPKLSESKLVYYGWKKNIISEDNYQRYIRQWDKNIIKPTSFPITYSIPSFENPLKKAKHHWYLDFIQKQLFATLGNKDLQQLFSCCQMIEVIANQVVCKLGYLFDFLYVILEGQFQYCEKNSEESSEIADKRQLFGLKDLKNRQNTYSYTLRSVTKGTVMRIDKNNLYFHLYDLLQ